MKYLFSVIAFCACLSVSAQYSSSFVENAVKIRMNPMKNKVEVWGDDVDGEGRRTINSSMRAINAKGSSVVIGLYAKVKDGNVQYGINMYYTDSKHNSLREGSPVLIKLGDDSRLELSTLFVYDMPPVTISLFGARSVYYCFLSCAITEEQIMQFAKGLKKIRFEANGSSRDVEVKKDNISQFLIDSFNLVKDSASTAKSFDDGF